MGDRPESRGRAVGAEVPVVLLDHTGVPMPKLACDKDQVHPGCDPG